MEFLWAKNCSFCPLCDGSIRKSPFHDIIQASVTAFCDSARDWFKKIETNPRWFLGLHSGQNNRFLTHKKSEKMAQKWSSKQKTNSRHFRRKIWKITKKGSKINSKLNFATSQPIFPTVSIFLNQSLGSLSFFCQFFQIKFESWLDERY